MIYVVGKPRSCEFCKRITELSQRDDLTDEEHVTAVDALFDLAHRARDVRRAYTRHRRRRRFT